jgi:hypothetical protein
MKPYLHGQVKTGCESLLLRFLTELQLIRYQQYVKEAGFLNLENLSYDGGTGERLTNLQL